MPTDVADNTHARVKAIHASRPAPKLGLRTRPLCQKGRQAKPVPHNPHNTNSWCAFLSEACIDPTPPPPTCHTHREICFLFRGHQAGQEQTAETEAIQRKPRRRRSLLYSVFADGVQDVRTYRSGPPSLPPTTSLHTSTQTFNDRPPPATTLIKSTKHSESATASQPQQASHSKPAKQPQHSPGRTETKERTRRREHPPPAASN